MSRRKTVKLNLPYVQKRIKAVFRRNVIFCEAMGRPQQRTWVTEWNREHNLPSPEEAARMCVLLQTTPEEILVEQADIDLVNGLLEQEREKSAKKERPAEGGTLDDDPDMQEIYNYLRSASAETRKNVKQYVQFMMNQEKDNV